MSSSTKLTTEIFVKRAKKIHKNKYDYSLVNYINAHTKVIIICSIHGQFLQTPDSHISKKTKCPYCAPNAKKTTEQFIEQAKIIHNDKYDYSQTLYVKSNQKINIICLIHGSFSQRPNRHLAGDGCPKCSKTERKTYEEFIKEASIKHNNKYNYSKVVYKNNKQKIIIICPIHGDFIQKPLLHLRGNGCTFCAPNKINSQSDFIMKAQLVHGNKYDYSQSIYVNGRTKIKIICSKHGEFKQIAKGHLRGVGCNLCSMSRVSKIETQWLNFLNIPEHYRQPTIKINNKNYYPDAYDPNTNTIYEFYGDYWHGNLNIYKPTDINFVNKKSYQELYDKTMKREHELKNAGYTIVSIWENDFKNLLK